MTATLQPLQPLLADVRQLIDAARQRVAQVVNAELTQLYWLIGRRISTALLHGQRADYGKQVMAELARVVRGAVFNVAVNIRKSSPTFGKLEGIELSEDNHKQLWVPPELAHGFVVTSESADFYTKLPTITHLNMSAASGGMIQIWPLDGP